MTYEEALKIMENEKRCVIRAENCDRNCAECDLVMPAEEIIAAYEITKTAIEKQIPKKVTPEIKFIDFGGKPIKTYGYFCPTCDRFISMYNGMESGIIPHHCKCGQALY